jgi:ubiquinone biosynthesis protein COQ9
MRPTKIYYEQLFPTGAYSNQRYGVEITLDDTDSTDEAFAIASKMANDAFLKLNPQIKWSDGVIDEAPKEINLAHEKVEIAIDNATTLAELQQLKNDCLASPNLIKSYGEKLKPFQSNK